MPPRGSGDLATRGFSHLAIRRFVDPLPQANQPMSQCCCRMPKRWSLIRPRPFLSELPVLPLLTRRTPLRGAGRLIRLIQIHRRQPRPVSTPVLRRKQPLNPGDEGMKAANHSQRIRPRLPDSDHSNVVWNIFAGNLTIIFFSRLSLDHCV